jgi:ADP-ribose pyrophosphatase YjhB (NUDIX family)
MTDFDKKSRCGFVVIRLRVAGDTYLLMRRDRQWNDWNFIGGHEKSEDGHSLMAAARRELLEEVPQLRGKKHFGLHSITEQIDYGPIQSRSSGKRVVYELEFFQLVFTEAPNEMLDAITARSANRLVREEELLQQRSFRVSGLVAVLDRAIVRGIRSLGYSWPEDLKRARLKAQLELPFQWHENIQVPDDSVSGSQIDKADYDRQT